MSYEGHTQVLTKDGLYRVYDAYDYPDEGN